MHRVILAGVLALVAGCAGDPKPILGPGARLIYHGSNTVWALCDRGNLVYVSDGGAVSVIASGCPSGQP
jgi:hypothetical protein